MGYSGENVERMIFHLKERFMYGLSQTIRAGATEGRVPVHAYHILEQNSKAQMVGPIRTNRNSSKGCELTPAFLLSSCERMY